MSSAKLTLIGMYNYDQTIFNELVLPEGIDKDLFIQSLLMQSGEFEILYPQPEFMKHSIKIWSAKWFRTFAEWLRGTQQRWNPIYNFDRFEESRNNNKKDYTSKTTADYSDKRKVDLDDTRTADLKDKTTFDNTDTNTQTDAMTTEHSVAAYDSSAYSPSSKDVVTNGQTKTDHTGNVTNENTGTDIMKHTGTDDTSRKGTLSDQTGSEATEDIHEAHLYGNIGVTTSAAMLKEFYDISSWSLYEHMCDVFTSELLIPVYD